MLQTSICVHTATGKFYGCIHPGGWTDERVERLKRLWADGYSASIVAMMLGDVTRNAVIGKVHRLELPPRGPRARQPRPPRRMREKSPPKFAKAPVVPRIAVKLTAPEPKMLQVAELRSNHCRWPVGDPRKPGFGFCGEKVAPGSQPYCAYHQEIGHQEIGHRRSA